MLRLPAEGFVRSVEKHNCSLDALAEWVEGSITIASRRVSQSDVVDILHEEQIYADQDFAREYVGVAWAELDNRRRRLGAHAPYAVEGRHLRRVMDWRESPGFSFCLLLGLQTRYRRELDRRVAPDYPAQGELFERLTRAALSARGLGVHSAAWSRSASESFAERVTALADHLGESVSPGAVTRWVPSQVKDGGLDVVGHLSFPDGRGGRPVYLIQCASGADWKGKKSTPKVSMWTKLIDFTTAPLRGMAIPFALLDDEFRREANDDMLALLLDRNRLAAPPATEPISWPGQPLRGDLIAWTRPRLEALPLADE